MKKTYAMVILLLVLSVGSFGVIGSMVYERRDQVTITETVLEGDKTEAEGLTVVTRNQMGNHLFWDTTYQVGEEPLCETEYSFYQSKYEEVEDYVYQGMNMYEYLSYEPPSDWLVGLAEPKEEMSELQKEYKKLQAGLEKGETGTKTLYLKDYYEYYPIRMNIDLPNTVWTNEVPGTEVGEQPYDPKYVMNKFTEFFKIPVLESDHVTIYVSKEGVSEDGHHVYTSHGTQDQSYFELETVSDYTEDICYFAINNRKELYGSVEGDTVFAGTEYVDTSLIPGGYGIYAFSYGRASGEYHTGIDADSLKMVFPLDEKMLVHHMMIRDDQSRMVLLVEEKRAAYIMVIDLETMKEVQRFMLDETLYRRISPYVEIMEFDDFFAVLFKGEIAVISDENGVYTHEFTVEVEEKVPNGWYGIGRAMDYDGEKLVVLGNREGYWGNSYTCDFYLAVYNESGLIYLGQYENNLSKSSNSISYYQCRPNDVNTYTVKW